MKSRVRVILVGFGVLATTFALVRQAEATLGGTAASVATDRTALSAARRATTVLPNYTVQEIASDAVRIREYVSSGGVVFALSWDGLVHPDLTSLLGTYAAEYRQAEHDTPRHKGVRRREVRGSQVVVEKWGHMRNLHGRAYAPALVPAGVRLDEIK